MAIFFTGVFAVFAGQDLAFGWIIGVNVLGLLILAPLLRYFTKRAMLKSGLWGKPVAMLSSREVGTDLAAVLWKEWQLGFKPVMVFESGSVPRNGGRRDFYRKDSLIRSMDVAKKRGLDTLIVAMPYARAENLAKLSSLASTRFQYVIVISDLGGITNSAVIARDFAGSFGVEIRHTLLDPWARKSKRVLDLLATVLGGLLISPLLVGLAILIKLDSPGPVLYGHRRLGVGGNHFCCWKFRTMYTNADQLLNQALRCNPDLQAEWEQNFKLHDDPRVTRIGRFLRRISLDELPQLWNVLRGEMSLVGPRPIVDAEIPKYGTVYETYQRIKPGMSGFWQVSGRSDTSYDERIKLDSYYVHNWSMWLDLVILARTARSVVLSRGAY
jgi:Undecaprenyl-phosphate galactose phosphotransferase WbaP